MLKITIDEKLVKELLEKAIKDRVEEIAKEKYFLTYAELANYLNMSRPTIEKNLLTNGLKYYKVGAKYLFKRSEVDEFLDELTKTMNQTNNDFNNL